MTGRDEAPLYSVALMDGDEEITDLELAKQALADTTGTPVGHLEIEPDGIGGWNAQLPFVMAETLREAGWLGIENDRFRLEVEWS